MRNAMAVHASVNKMWKTVLFSGAAMVVVVAVAGVF
jgi:hypothetical protein